METVDITIIGAGVIGLAVAARLSSRGGEIVVLERHDGFGREASSRNSEVIHAGLYYPPDFLKTTLCVEGRRALYRRCEERGIPFRKTGKLLVARSEDEVKILEKIKASGDRNGVEGLRLLDRAETARLEPDVRAVAGLLSPETGIIDSHRLMEDLEREASSSAVVVYGCEVEAVEPSTGGFTVAGREADGSQFRVFSPVVVNCAGLGAAKIAALAGVETAAAGMTTYPCKGEYFRVSDSKKGRLSRLVYPPPTAISLGLHSVIDLAGALKLGPNAFYVDEIDYRVDESHRREFYLGVKDYLPFIEEEDLFPDQAGIRPKLYREGEPVRDFVIRSEAEAGLPGLINLVGIESPGLTACLAIADRVAALI